ncbi:MAG TPA: hypothetical protein V6D25_11880 [Leptolyngbyaceae cyanobacterium]
MLASSGKANQTRLIAINLIYLKKQGRIMYRTINLLKESCLQVIAYISGAVTRIFGIRDDNYPATGFQPFDGDSAKKQNF